jgi:hypothetical protein
MRNNEAVEEMGAWLEANRVAYNEAIQKLSDAKWVRGMMSKLREQMDDILMYNATQHEPHVAVFAAGRVQARTENLFADFDLLDQWEEEKQRYDEAVAELNKQEEGISPDHL